MQAKSYDYDILQVVVKSRWTLGISISGTVYSDEGTTPIGVNRVVAVKVNGSGSATSGTAANGTYTIDGITINAAGDTLTLYLDAATYYRKSQPDYHGFGHHDRHHRFQPIQRQNHRQQRNLSLQ